MLVLLAVMKPALLHALPKRMTSLQIHRCCCVKDQWHGDEKRCTSRPRRQDVRTWWLSTSSQRTGTLSLGAPVTWMTPRNFWINSPTQSYEAVGADGMDQKGATLAIGSSSSAFKWVSTHRVVQTWSLRSHSLMHTKYSSIACHRSRMLTWLCSPLIECISLSAAFSYLWWDFFGVKFFIAQSKLPRDI